MSNKTEDLKCLFEECDLYKECLTDEELGIIEMLDSFDDVSVNKRHSHKRECNTKTQQSKAMITKENKTMYNEKKFDISNKILLNLEELQECLGVGYNTALNLMHTGPFCVRIGRRIYANRELLAEWLKSKSGMYSSVENLLDVKRR